MGTVLENSHGCSCRSLVGLRRVVWGCRVWVGGNMWYATMKLGSRVTHLCVSPPLDIADKGGRRTCVGFAFWLTLGKLLFKQSQGIIY